ncbi:exopolyphosphatase [Thalassorhabdus alkalitolerans]|uniref:Exopolyphosphatase n=1 Tax=Thalassorhabdus alkalitolerans TaxID=2282697 RepID=A0ABW0YLT5_9BACI
MKKEKVGVLDIGSNSIRLVIHKIDDQKRYRQLHNLKQVARLSSHIDLDGRLTPEGFEVLKSALIQFEEIIQHHHVTKVKVAATAAIRNAVNQQDILDFIHKETSLYVRVLSGKEEAYYGYLAVVNSTSLREGITVDIGGGSTEVTYFHHRRLIYSHSFPFGALTLKKQFYGEDGNRQANPRQFYRFLKNEFAKIPWLKNKKVPVIGIGGSARNMALIHQRKEKYPLAGLHQYSMAPKQVESTLRLLEQTPLSKRADIEGLSKDRADIIVPAVRVIQGLMEYSKSPFFIMSNKGLRDGLLFEEILRDEENKLFPNVTEESFYQLGREYEIQHDHISEVSRLAEQLYSQLENHLPYYLKQETNVYLLKTSAKVLYMGEYIDDEASVQHTFYLLTNRSIDGISHQERLAIAFISSFKSQSYLQQFATPYKRYVSQRLLQRYELLGSILKLAYSLNRTRRNVITHLDTRRDGKNIAIHLYCTPGASPYFEEIKSEKYKKHLEKTLGKKISLYFHREESSYHKV